MGRKPDDSSLQKPARHTLCDSNGVGLPREVSLCKSEYFSWVLRDE